MGVPYEYIRIWDVPYAYGPIYAYGACRTITFPEFRIHPAIDSISCSTSYIARCSTSYVLSRDLQLFSAIIDYYGNPSYILAYYFFIIDDSSFFDCLSGLNQCTGARIWLRSVHADELRCQRSKVSDFNQIHSSTAGACRQLHPVFGSYIYSYQDFLSP